MTDEPDPETLRARYGPRLRAELAELQAQSGASAGDRKPVTLDQQSVGRLSRMDAMQAQSMAAALEERRRRRVTMIARALARLDGEDFGWCDDCGAFIGLPRLDVDPVVRRCVDCA